MKSLVDKLFSIRSDIQLRVLAIMILAGIAFIMSYPLITNPDSSISTAQAGVITLSIFGLIIIILSDRIVSLNVSKDKLNITLSGLKKDVKETIESVREDIQKESPPSEESHKKQEKYHELESKIKEVETVVAEEKGGESVEELIENAKDMGKVMGMLGDIMKSYRAYKNSDTN